ncbi:MAG TPA: hypothetical protein VLR90_08585 [Blastocatellia bacterium]|nr:hypothetical protein [Blastocatellia bacterium]
MGTLATIEVYMNGVDSPVIINESDFDPAIHRKEESDSTTKDPKQPKEPKEPKQPAE